MASSRRSLPVTMPVTALSHTPHDSEWVRCLNCGECLGLVQPEKEEPERLVGSCATCGSWYLLDWDAGSRTGLMVLLPGHEQLMQGYESIRVDSSG